MSNGVIDLRNLPPRDDVLRSMIDIRDITRARMQVIRLGRRGQLNEEAYLITPGSLDFFHFVNVDVPQQERAQITQNHSDDGKVYYFGRSHRMYSFSGFIVDTNLDDGQGSLDIDQALGGKTYKEWKRLYDKYLRVGAAVSNRAIIKISWRVSKMFGYLLNYTASQDSMRPHQININFAFISIKDEERESLPFVKTLDSLFRGSISREGAERVLKEYAFLTDPLPPRLTPISPSENRIGSYIGDRAIGGMA